MFCHSFTLPKMYQIHQCKPLQGVSHFYYNWPEYTRLPLKSKSKERLSFLKNYLNFDKGRQLCIECTRTVTRTPMKFKLKKKLANFKMCLDQPLQSNGKTLLRYKFYTMVYEVVRILDEVYDYEKKM